MQLVRVRFSNCPMRIASRSKAMHSRHRTELPGLFVRLLCCKAVRLLRPAEETAPPPSRQDRDSIRSWARECAEAIWNWSALALIVTVLFANAVAPSSAADHLLPWERIENTCPQSAPTRLSDCAFSERLKVQGGWLVRSTRVLREPAVSPAGITGGGIGVGTGLTFLPDPTYSWQP